MRISERPHFEISADELAIWIERQGDRWWNVDGDARLTRVLDLPCPADEIAAELRHINEPLLVQARKDDSNATGRKISANEVDHVVARLGDNVQVNDPSQAQAPWLQDRVLWLCWKQSPNEEWMLIEDEETRASESNDATADASEKR